VFGEVYCAFWKEEPSLRQVLHMIDSDDIYVVPNFISEGYFTRTVIPRELELTGPVTQRDGRTIKYCEPAGSHPRMTELLLRRAAEIAPGVPPEETTLYIVGHGTNLNDNSAVAAKREVERIRETSGYAQVLNAYMEEEPLISSGTNTPRSQTSSWCHSSSRMGCIAIRTFPVLLGIEQEVGAAASQRDVFRHNPHHLRGRTLFYASAIGTEPLFAEIVLDQVAAFDAQHGAVHA
jgi:sirohydrochlorin cobaltochelatase